MSSPLSPDVVEGFGDETPPEAPKDHKELAGRSPTRIAMSRLGHDKVAMTCSVILVILILLAIFAPLISNALGIYVSYDFSDPSKPRPSDLLDQDALNGHYGYPLSGPPYHGFDWKHPLGIEPKTAYDNLALLLYGLRTSLSVATLATVISTVVGVTLGLVAGYAKGWVDSLLSFVIDFFLSFPFLLGALALAPIITSRFSGNAEQLKQAELYSLVAILVIFGWMGLARLIRGQVLSLREREFVQAAQVIGVPTRAILFKELLPNLVAPIVVAISLSMPGFVAAEAGLSYLGIGLTGRPSLGRTVNNAQNYYETYPLYLFAPVLMIMVLVITLNLVGDSVRDAFDPKTRR